MSCLGDGVCTNPRCATHGVEWDAVPQPVDREALEEAIREPFSWLGARQMYADEVRRAADAVLALLAGEQEQVESP